MAKTRRKQNTDKDRNPSLMELALDPKARRKLTDQFTDRMRQNLIEVLTRQGGDHPLLSQLRPKDRTRK